MEMTDYVRKPFIVEAIQITPENIQELAPEIGILRQKEDGTPYIQVDRRLISPSIVRVYIGYWLTRMGENIGCYSNRVFKNQFVMMDANIRSWVEFINSETISDDLPEQED